MSESHESNPFLHQAEKFRGEVERLVERLKDQGERALDSIGVRPFGVWHPPADIVETPEHAHLSVRRRMRRQSSGTGGGSERS